MSVFLELFFSVSLEFFGVIKLLLCDVCRLRLYCTHAGLFALLLFPAVNLQYTGLLAVYVIGAKALCALDEVIGAEVPLHAFILN